MATSPLPAPAPLYEDPVHAGPTDPVVVQDGQDVFRSADLDIWTPAGRFFDGSGTRPGDQGIGHHVDVVAGADAAWVLYFTHPDRDAALLDSHGPRQRRSVVRLTRHGDRLLLDRDTAALDALPLP
ncbi:hypothetical protein [Streptomyces sp. NPDC101776]|uniref:hypothetical protein n=1 Tax=Streptomyces sp. NPDC101776 TaxID=3366146 RepID=UPI0037F95743